MPGIGPRITFGRSGLNVNWSPDYHSILELAEGYGIRVAAEGIETRADFIAANELGFDLVQGHLFGKPMALKKFARSALVHTVLASE